MFKKYIPGLGLSLAIAAIATCLGKAFPLFGSSVFAILLGILLNHFWKIPQKFHLGLAFSGKKLLQYSIILLGFSLSISKVSATGLSSLKISILTILLAFLSAYLIGRFL